MITSPTFTRREQEPALISTTSSIEKLLQPGDLVFISIINPLYRHVAASTQSKATHVGIAFHDEQKGWVIAESTVPFAKCTPLTKFIARSHDSWIAVRRLRTGLSAEQLIQLRAACDARMGIVYELGFRYDSPRLFCSKLAYDCYREATGMEIGTLETFSDLLKKHPDQSQRFWQLWFFGRIPWSRRTVTPASQLHSAALVEVYSTNDGADYCPDAMVDGKRRNQVSRRAFDVNRFWRKIQHAICLLCMPTLVHAIPVAVGFRVELIHSTVECWRALTHAH